ncbi:rep protein [Circoviridae sp.]|nr:rep protein [Circoviridae sp.]
MAKHWVFTLNNPTLEEKRDYWDRFSELKDLTYLCIGLEKGEGGTPHFQGYVCFKTKKRFTGVKKFIARAHWEIMRGNPLEASNYCQKDGNFKVMGELPPDPKESGARGGKRKAEHYLECIDLAKKGKFEELKTAHPDMYWNSYHTMKRIRMDHPDNPVNLNVLDNEWIWGVPGIGKSRTARAENPGCYIKSHNKWWLGYSGEEVVLIDDLGKTDAPWIGEFLKTWGDHYPFPAETKGDGSVIRPRRIIITSNYSPEMLWPEDEELIKAIRRRYAIRNMVVPFQHVVPETPEITQNQAEMIDLVSEEEELSTASTDEIEWTQDSNE